MTGRRKESVVSDVVRTLDELPSVVAKLTTTDTLYPFSQVLRLRVLQVVCGISVVVMGAVACIDDRTALTKLGLGVPAGLVTVIAAAASIHTSRGFGGYRASTCGEGSLLRVLGPNLQIAAFLTLLWMAACCLQAALFIQSLITIKYSDTRESQTSFLVALVQLVLSSLTLLAVILVLRVDCLHDPD
ncbi:uncharacterized protein LOC142321900 [Lycorma delicatula]|uniref:uncharacterized protein LOC142321900 n=1 Tax=Lycorma delicatula TaxID=130591 RepID=UPI003F510F2B